MLVSYALVMRAAATSFVLAVDVDNKFRFRVVSVSMWWQALTLTVAMWWLALALFAVMWWLVLVVALLAVPFWNAV